MGWKNRGTIIAEEVAMERFLKSACVMIVMPLFFGCGSGGDRWNAVMLENFGIQEVTFEDKGAVVPNPLITTVSMDSGSIRYSESQSDQVIGEWSKPIEIADFRSVRTIISDNKLYMSEDVLPSGQFPCLGSHEMTISIRKDNNIHSFTIDGGVYCDRSQWPSGVRELVELKDTLVEKYKSQ